VKEIIAKLTNEFQHFPKGIEEPSRRFVKKFGTSLEMPKDYVFFLKLHNGIKRLKNDKYFTFQIFSIDKLYFLDQMGDMPEEEKIEFLGLEEDDFSGDWISIASEGEYGVYAMNFNSNSPKFGVVYGIVNNIPDRFAEWKNFTEFLKGLIPYCKQFPLVNYRKEKPGSDPWYVG
jgi:hypothetical protein